MPASTFSSVWDRLSPETRARLVRDPARDLGPGDVDELARAGGRTAHAMWFDTRPGHQRRWSTSWSFRHFVEQVRRDQPTADERSGRRWEWRRRSARRLDLRP